MEVLARYKTPGPDFWVADLPLADLAEEDIPAWEALYGINLHPRWLVEDPCILAMPFGAGTVLLSYAHLESPASSEANALLATLLGVPAATVPQWDLRILPQEWSDPQLQTMRLALLELIELGQRHFLLNWRTPWLLGWRRGIPAAHLTTLLAMTVYTMDIRPTQDGLQWWENHGALCLKLCLKLCQETKAYLIRERYSMASAPSSPEYAGSAGLQATRHQLFGSFPGYGGLYGQMVHLFEELLARLLEAQGPSSNSLRQRPPLCAKLQTVHRGPAGQEEARPAAEQDSHGQQTCDGWLDNGDLGSRPPERA